ncbi:hypothetical protein [Cytobacillus solani]|uniref:hypothetical protein n=1 Tax=Cytobacillus solani TaxID=1637975 RepID=UPI000AFD085A|nr:hypothetical protein [Cytobacillus solani]
MNFVRKLEKLIAIYFNGENYTIDNYELSRKDSKLIAYSLIHTLQQFEWVMQKRKE